MASENPDQDMARRRAMLTDTERDLLISDEKSDRYYQAVSRIRRKINEELTEDIQILEDNHPELLDELCRVVQINPRLADGIKAYVGVKDYEETGENEILFDGEPIQRVAAGGGENSVDWGYAGTGPHNAARSILNHAKQQLEMDDTSVTFKSTPFQNSFIRGQEGSYWAIPLSQVRNWMEYVIEQKAQE